MAMKRNHRITPQKYKELMTLSGTLPVLYRTIGGDNLSNNKVMHKTYSAPVKTDYLTKEEIAKIKDFDPKKRYIKHERKPVTVNHSVNHSVNLIEAYKRHGDVGVASYVARVRYIAGAASGDGSKAAGPET